MPIHKIIRGGEEYLPFALAQERKLRATGVPYISKAYEIGDVSISVKLEGEHSHIRIEKEEQGGYGVVAISDLYTPAEFSIVSDIRERDANPPVPPYKRTANKYDVTNVSYWVGGPDRTKPKVSHVDLDRQKYVIDGGPTTQWTGPDTLVKVVRIGTPGTWAFVSLASDFKSYGVYAQAAAGFTAVGTLAVGTDGSIRADDIPHVDASPDGRKIMFVWSEEDPQLSFRTDRFVREVGVINPSPPGTPLPSLSTTTNDTRVLDHVTSDTRDPDTGSIWGTIVDEKHDFFGYDWAGTLKYATVETSFSNERGAESPPPPAGNYNPLGDWPPGTYVTDDGRKTLRRTLKIGGSTVRQATGVGTATTTLVLRQVPGTPAPASEGEAWVTEPASRQIVANMAADDFVLAFFDPRSGAYAITKGIVARTTTVSQTFFVGPFNVGDVLGSVTVSNATTTSARELAFVFGPRTKNWELTPASSTGTSDTAPITGPVLTGSSAPYPEAGLSVVSSFLQTRFASRRPGEGVLSFYVLNKSVFAVTGQRNDVAFFISDDARGLKKHSEAGFRAISVYPI